MPARRLDGNPGSVGLYDVVGMDVPGSDGTRPRRTQAEPQARGLLPVGIFQYHCMALRGEISRDIGGQRGLANAAFRVGVATTITGMTPSIWLYFALC